MGCTSSKELEGVEQPALIPNVNQARAGIPIIESTTHVKPAVQKPQQVPVRMLVPQSSHVIGHQPLVISQPFLEPIIDYQPIQTYSISSTVLQPQPQFFQVPLHQLQPQNFVQWEPAQMTAMGSTLPMMYRQDTRSKVRPIYDTSPNSLGPSIMAAPSRPPTPTELLPLEVGPAMLGGRIRSSSFTGMHPDALPTPQPVPTHFAISPTDVRHPAASRPQRTTPAVSSNPAEPVYMDERLLQRPPIPATVEAHWEPGNALTRSTPQVNLQGNGLPDVWITQRAPTAARTYSEPAMQNTPIPATVHFMDALPINGRPIAVPATVEAIPGPEIKLQGVPLQGHTVRFAADTVQIPASVAASVTSNSGTRSATGNNGTFFGITRGQTEQKGTE
eukprot:TRINITY_DN13504_c0_g1_i2.p1 TRINITY_DN13504_c0_g1~~TRINITY_DN13504_c0_g1_i2.p1  ORF type:complete len:389 (+),score=25.17 TRINITY_DN13504_c0_g1_i2:56-1222(+)